MTTVLPIVLGAAAVLIALLQLIYSYATGEPEHRKRFWALLRHWVEKAAPAAVVIRKKLFLIGAGLCGCLVAVSAGSEIVKFVISAEPIRRPEVLMLLLNALNAFAYGVLGISLVLAAFTKGKPSRANPSRGGRLILSRKEGESIHLSVAPGTDAEQLLRHLLRDGITVLIGGVGSGQVRVSIEAPAEILILRDELDQQRS